MISLHRQHVDIVICVQTSKKNLFEQLIHLDILIHPDFICVWWRVDFAWWRDGLLVANWLVAKLPVGKMTGIQVHVHIFASTDLIPDLNCKNLNLKLNEPDTSYFNAIMTFFF